MVKQLPQWCGRPRPPRLLPVNPVQRVCQEEEESHAHPGPAGDLVLAGQGGLSGRLEVVVVQRQQTKVTKTTDEPNEGQEVWSHPQWTQLDYLETGESISYQHSPLLVQTWFQKGCIT